METTNASPEVHVCLVSRQPTPNLTPALDPAIRPRRVVLLVSPDMRARADWLESVLNPRGVRTAQWPIADAWDVEHIQTRVLELLEGEKRAVATASIVLNATGGTKPMSIAAYEAFRAYDLPIFYIHPEQDRLIWMHPSDRLPVELADRVKLEAFLQAHGVHLDSTPHRNLPDTKGLELAGRVVSEIEGYGPVLPRLNYLAHKARRSLVSPVVREDGGALSGLIDLFENEEYLTRNNGRLRFRSEEDRFFVNGGWIEGLVFDAVRQVRAEDQQIQDVAYNLVVSRDQAEGPVRNELDVVFLRNNRLHIIECKTKRFPGGEQEDTPGAEALYKLDTLRDLMGGLQARAMLLGYLDLDDHSRRRAADLDIAVCAGSQLHDLRGHLARFMH